MAWCYAAPHLQAHKLQDPTDPAYIIPNQALQHALQTSDTRFPMSTLTTRLRAQLLPPEIVLRYEIRYCQAAVC